MKRKLAAGLVLLGAVVAGVVLGLLLVSRSGSPPSQPPPPSPPPAHSTAATTPDAAEVAAVKVVATAIIDAITRHDSAAFGKLTCRPQTTTALADLQRKWDAAGQVRAALAESPQLGGDSATVRVHVEGDGGKKDTPFPLKKQDGKWCVPG